MIICGGGGGGGGGIQHITGGAHGGGAHGIGIGIGGGAHGAAYPHGEASLLTMLKKKYAVNLRSKNVVYYKN